MRRIPLFALCLSLAVPMLARGEDAASDGDRDDGQVHLVRERDGFYCRAGTEHWTPQQVIAERIAALQAGDFQRMVCTYAIDAVVIMPGSVIRGRANIAQGLAGFGALFGNAPLVFDSEDFANDVAFVTFHVIGELFSIPNGGDTYVIRHGRIQTHTVHDDVQPTAH